MTGTIINICYSKNTYKKALCKCCGNKLVEGSKILSISRAQGRFVSSSNYCGKCTETELQSAMDEIMPLMQSIIKIQETLDSEKQMATKIEECFNEATRKFGTTLEKLGNE